MIDENAFGFFFSYFTVEHDEYALEREPFVERFEAFRSAVLECLRELPLGDDARAVDFGHGIYVEIADGDHTEDPISWARMIRSKLTGREFESAVVVTHGSRWIPEEDDASAFSTEFIGDVSLVTVSRPSEPLRRALYADTACRVDDEDTPGWGPGLYVDTEVIDALDRKLKNAPTPLAIAGATYFRVAR